MDLKEKIDFLQKVNVGDKVEIEYKRTFGKNKTIKGQVYEIGTYFVNVDKSKNIFAIDTGYKHLLYVRYIPFDKIVEYKVKEKFKLD